MAGETIFAEATAPGRAGISVIRLSGPQVPATLQRLTGACPAPRRAVFTAVRHPGTGAVLDRGLVLFFEEGHSFTGEAVGELQLHGSRAVVRAVLAALASEPDLRPAEPGEFTRRALHHGRMDLPQVEALADLLSAQTERQRQQAASGLDGALSKKADRWRAGLLRAAALLEASLDFADEDVPDSVVAEAQAALSPVRQDIAAEIAGIGAAEQIRDGFVVAIVGRPNVGKSTLLNAIAARDVALTSDIPGTTRDVLEVHIDLGGLPVTLVDTAGVRDTDDRVEALGVQRARDRAAQADLRVFLVEGDIEPVMAPEPQDLVVTAKADLAPGLGLSVSGLTGAGVSAVLERMQERLEGRLDAAGTATNLRQRVALEAGHAALTAAEQGLRAEPVLSDLVAEDLRRGLGALDSLIGRVGVEDLLDVVFSSFCIGK
ncbi:MAG: tRNA uridine-5-carboxymethylaminomethyl(34) synthesis GTPase MnmE [Pseudomonadota bacterium]